MLFYYTVIYYMYFYLFYIFLYFILLHLTCQARLSQPNIKVCLDKLLAFFNLFFYLASITVILSFDYVIWSFIAGH